MKKLSILTAIMLACGVGASAQAPCFPATAEFQPQKVDVKYAPSAKASMPQRSGKRTTPPASITGKKFVTYYGSFSSYGQCAGSIIVEAAGDSVLLKGIAKGHDLKGKYDPATGKITIPTGKPLYTTSDGKLVSIYNLLRSSNWDKYNSQPVVATVDGDFITFADGLYGTDGELAYIWMDDIKARQANAMLKIDNLKSDLSVYSSYYYPVLVEKTTDTQLTIHGMAQWLYYHDYRVKVNFNKSTNIATIPTSNNYVDYYKSGDSERFIEIRYRKDSAVNSVTVNPTFDIENGTNQSKLTPKWIYFEGYKEGTGLRGWTLGNITLTADMDFYNGPISNQATIDSINYHADPVSGEATVTGAVADCTNAAIKSKVTIDGREYAVTAIGEKAFYGNKKITRVSLPASIKSIGTQAFQNASNCKNVNIEDLTAWCDISIPAQTASPLYVCFPSSSTSTWGNLTIGGKAFDGTLTIPDGVKAINPYAFCYLRAVKKVVLPAGLTALKDHCFFYCDSLQDIKLPEGLTELTAAFYNCNSLQSIELPRSLEVLGKDAFDNCKKLTEVKMHTGLKVISQWAFYGCSALTELTLPPSLDSIGTAVFTGAKAITKLTCRATTPPAVAVDGVFSPFAANCTLYVPKNSVEAYKEAEGWKNFKTFEINTGVEGIDCEDTDAPAVYYNLQGMKVANPTGGIYIEKRGNRTRKVIIR